MCTVCRCGAGFLPPEAQEGSPLTPAADVYQFGGLCYFMALGSYPPNPLPVHGFTTGTHYTPVSLSHALVAVHLYIVQLYIVRLGFRQYKALAKQVKQSWYPFRNHACAKHRKGRKKFKHCDQDDTPLSAATQSFVEERGNRFVVLSGCKHYTRVHDTVATSLTVWDDQCGCCRCDTDVVVILLIFERVHDAIPFLHGLHIVGLHCLAAASQIQNLDLGAAAQYAALKQPE